MVTIEITVEMQARSSDAVSAKVVRVAEKHLSDREARTE
jgi:hypothetical protein